MKISVCVFWMLLLGGCTAPGSLPSKEPRGLRFLDLYTLGSKTQFKGTTVGGLSGIDFDPLSGLYYLICDDRSEINPSRFYTARIRLEKEKISSVEMVDVVTLRNERGESYANFLHRPDLAADPESIRFHPKQGWWIWTGEGERLLRNDTFFIQHPSVNWMSADGRRTDSFSIPANLRVQKEGKGPRRNGVWEGSTFDQNYQYLYVSTEEPLYEDGPRAGLRDSSAWVRFIKFDVASQKPVAQYGYQIDPVVDDPDSPGGFRVNGVSEILWLDRNRLLVMERSYSAGQAGSSIRIYLATITNATDVTKITSLSAGTGFVPLAKRLLLDLRTLNIPIDNLEGMTLGPKLANGRQSLILVSDDNFSDRNKTQFLLFQIE